MNPTASSGRISLTCPKFCIEFPCDCGETCHAQRTDDAGSWFIQHGANPEHRSPIYAGDSLFLHGSREWRAQIHARQHVA